MATATIPRQSRPTGVALASQSEPRITLSLRRLLLVYLVIPLCLGIYLFDQLVAGGAIQTELPSRPQQYALFQLFFGWPHIVASTIIITTNREYMAMYWRKLLVVSALVIGFFGIGNFALPYNVLFAVAATATIIHVLKQQIGIGRGAARVQSRTYTAWGWIGIAMGVLLYNALFLSELESYRGQITALTCLLGCAFIVLARRAHREMATGLGRRFLWSNTAMVLVGLFFYTQGYGIFAIAIPRIVHDTTAFAFYVAHDANKHGSGPRNWVYRLTGRFPGAVCWVLPVTAVCVAWALRVFGNDVVHFLTSDALRASAPRIVSLGLFGYLGMMHYYYESFTWKTGSPLRRYVSLRA